MDFWAARDAYNAIPVLVLIGVVVVLVGLGYAIDMVKWFVGS